LRVYEAFQRSGLATHIGEERFFRERKYAINYAKEQFGDALDIEPLQHFTPVKV
jgi:SulP family sulfate permease